MLHLFQPLAFSSHRVATTSEHPGRQRRNTKGLWLKSPQPSEKYFWGDPQHQTIPNSCGLFWGYTLGMNRKSPAFSWFIGGSHLAPASTARQLLKPAVRPLCTWAQHQKSSTFLNYPGKKTKKNINQQLDFRIWEPKQRLANHRCNCLFLGKKGCGWMIQNKLAEQLQ